MFWNSWNTFNNGFWRLKLKCFALEKRMFILNAHDSYTAGNCLFTTDAAFFFSKQDYYTLYSAVLFQHIYSSMTVSLF